MIANIALKARGYFKIEAINSATGRRRVVADWFPNLITNNGFDQYLNSSVGMNSTTGPMAYCRVGSGTATPAVTDSALQSQVASTNTIQSTTLGRASVSPYYAFITRVYRFNPGVATGNLSEIGVAPAATGNLFSRALILDGFGSPTTITVLAGEILDVTYQFRLYAPTSDVTGTITLDGVSTTYTIRPIGVLTSSYWNISSFGPSYAGALNDATLYTGNIVAMTASGISGAGPASTTYTPQAYVNGNKYKDYLMVWEYTVTPNTYNSLLWCHATGIPAPCGGWQIGFSPGIVKTNVNRLTLTLRFSLS